MDEIYQLGLTQLFVSIVLVVIKIFKIDLKYSHLDSSSFHLHGEYESGETPEKDEPIIKERPILIKKGYSRDHRPDLKQCVLDLIVNNQEGIPLFMRTVFASDRFQRSQFIRSFSYSHISYLNPYVIILESKLT